MFAELTSYVLIAQVRYWLSNVNFEYNKHEILVILLIRQLNSKTPLWLYSTTNQISMIVVY